MIFSSLMKLITSKLLTAGELALYLEGGMSAPSTPWLDAAGQFWLSQGPRSLIVRARLTRLLVRLIGTALIGSPKTTLENDLILLSELKGLILELAELRSSLTSALVATENSKTG